MFSLNGFVLNTVIA